jgi:hypothetical protein
MTTTINASNSGSGGLVQTADASGILALQTAGTTAVTINASQNVGVGTASPSSKLHVRSDADALTVIQQIQNRNAGASAGGVIAFINANNDLFDNRYGYIGAVTSGAGQNGTNLVFATNPNGGAPVERMRIDSSGNLLFNSGYGSVATAYGCRAWVNFNGTGTVAIRGSGNVTSITDNGTGDYTVNFTTAMPDVNYSPVGVGSNATNDGTSMVQSATAPTTSAWRTNCKVYGSTQFDPTYAYIQVFR